jgi:hypothetical protein
MDWGKGIIAAFIFFALFIGVLVAVTMKEDIGLVSKTYYAEEIDYQAQLDRKNNTERLENKPEITIEQNQYLKVYFPSVSMVEGGEVKLFRPSHDNLDQRFQLRSSSDSVQVFYLEPLTKGSYRIKMKWAMEGKEYYMEKMVVI